MTFVEIILYVPWFHIVNAQLAIDGVCVRKAKVAGEVRDADLPVSMKCRVAPAGFAATVMWNTNPAEAYGCLMCVGVGLAKSKCRVWFLL